MQFKYIFSKTIFVDGVKVPVKQITSSHSLPFAGGSQGRSSVHCLETHDLEVRSTIFSLDDPECVSMLTSIFPRWNALKCNPASLSAAGVLLPLLTLTSELPGLVENVMKEFPCRDQLNYSLKHCDRSYGWSYGGSHTLRIWLMISSIASYH